MPTLSASGKEALDRLFARASEEKKIPHFVFGATNVDGELYFRGSGTRIFDDPTSGELTPDSVFWICSQTKFIANIAALKLVEQGKLSFDTPVSNYIPELKTPVVISSSEPLTFKPAETTITLMHVFNHSSGLYYKYEISDPHYKLPTPYTIPHDGEVDDVYKNFYDKIKGEFPSIPLGCEPGTSFRYGWSTDIVGYIVEKASGQTLEEYCKKHIFDPLGMKFTSFYLTPELKERIVCMAFRDADGKFVRFTNQTPLIEQDPSKVRLHFGGIGLYSSLRDYLTLLRHVLQIQAGRPVPNPILKVDTVNSFFVPTLTAEGEKSATEIMKEPTMSHSTALGVTTADWPGKRRKGSGFWGGWAGTEQFIDPTTGVAAIFGTQLCSPGDPEEKKLWAELEEVLYAGLEN